ncbi:MAG: leucine-rich repeat protein, partial [Clostridia bacterium]|nr:leucine-rich repeat protein [Clostridia bacterium]
ILAFCCVFGLAACSENDNDDGNENQGTVQTPADKNNGGESKPSDSSNDGDGNSQSGQDKLDESDDNNQPEQKPEEQTSKLRYELYKDVYWVMGIGECTDTDIVIPATYNGLPVDLVSQYAFKGCKSITSVKISEGITYIGTNAFKGCSSLVSVTIPKSVTFVGDDAFSGCTGLTGVYISDLSAWCQIDFGRSQATADETNPLYYAHNLYLNNELITELIIPEDVTYIGSLAFTNCTSIKKATAHDGVISIGKDSPFVWCTSIEEIKGPAIFCVTAKYYAKKITITSGEIKSSYSMGAFSGAVLETLIMEDGVTKIGDSSFDGCSSLKEVIIGNGVTEIGRDAFWKCTSLTSITIPSNVRIIGSSAFSYCSSLEEVVVESGVEEVGNQAFFRCASLEKIKVGAAYIGGQAFDNCALKEIILLDGVVEIGRDAFGSYSSAYVYIPETVKIIGYRSFISGVKNLYYGGKIEQWKDIEKPQHRDDSYDSFIVKRIIHCADGNFDDLC